MATTLKSVNIGDGKDDAHTYELEVTPGAEDMKLGTRSDQRDMVRLGKKQELQRQFKFFSMYGYAVILGASWEYAFITFVLSLANGGTGGAVWGFLGTCFGMLMVNLSMAEMASMAPVSPNVNRQWVVVF